MSTWQVQSAKQRFSEVLRAAERGEPQFITKHGTPVAVIVDIEDYRRTHTPRPALADFLVSGAEAVALEYDLELPERRADPDRVIDAVSEAE